MAVSDDAAWLLVADDDRGRLRLMGASGSSTVLSEGMMTMTVGVAFAPGGHAAAILNAAEGWLDVYADVATASAQRIAAPSEKGTAPAGLAFSSDGKSVVAAARTGTPIAIFNLATGAASTLTCNCAPTGVARMGNLFRLTEAGAGPVWLVDTATTPARIVFVPALANP
jgi:DNA-binding beta-propeller fold protein YncE